VPICFDLSERGHGVVGRSVRMEALLSASLPRSGIVATECSSERFGAIADLEPVSPSTATAVPLGRACRQSLRAIGSGSILIFATMRPRRHAGAARDDGRGTPGQ
jgi:hypothetical protein